MKPMSSVDLWVKPGCYKWIISCSLLGQQIWIHTDHTDSSASHNANYTPTWSGNRITVVLLTTR